MIKRMKKVTKILFLFIYFVLTVGMTISAHFCGGIITAVQMLPVVPKEKPCCCSDAPGQDDCCKTEIKSLQLNDEQIAVQIDQPSSPQTDLNLRAGGSIEDMFSSNLIHTVLPACSPPGSPPSYILYCKLLI